MIDFNEDLMTNGHLRKNVREAGFKMEKSFCQENGFENVFHK